MFLDSSNHLPEQILDTLCRVSLLDNITVLRCHHDLGPDASLEVDKIVDRFDKYRGEVLTTLIIGLAKRNDTPSAPSRELKKLETLDICNLPCRSQPDLTDNSSFPKLLRTLQTLSLRFDYINTYDNPHRDYPRGEPREFFTRLPRAWLAPAAMNLTCLTLGAHDHVRWGYILKVDFRGVHFPQLQSLFMQRFMFSHDWQLEWILSHTTLKTLCLFQCRILTHACWFGEKDNEGYPTSLLKDQTLPLQDYHYARSWHQYYQDFLSRLEHLKWFTTTPDDGSEVTDLIGLYEEFDRHTWLQVIPEPGRRAEDKRMLIALKVTARGHLEPTAKPHVEAEANSRPRH